MKNNNKLLNVKRIILLVIFISILSYPLFASRGGGGGGFIRRSYSGSSSGSASGKILTMMLEDPVAGFFILVIAGVLTFLYNLKVKKDKANTDEDE